MTRNNQLYYQMLKIYGDIAANPSVFCILAHLQIWSLSNKVMISCAKICRILTMYNKMVGQQAIYTI